MSETVLDITPDAAATVPAAQAEPTRLSITVFEGADAASPKQCRIELEKSGESDGQWHRYDGRCDSLAHALEKAVDLVKKWENQGIVAPDVGNIRWVKEPIGP